MKTSAVMATKLSLTFPLVADENAATIKAFGVFDSANQIAWPAVFILDGERRVVWRELSETYKKRPSSAEILKALDETNR